MRFIQAPTFMFSNTIIQSCHPTHFCSTYFPPSPNALFTTVMRFGTLKVFEAILEPINGTRHNLTTKNYRSALN